MLALFPPSSLDNSILTPVLIGLLVVWLFQETLGWNFTGLVVPGYLASILAIAPTTALVVLGEALVTWAIVLVISERVPAWWPWTRLFGRDRFFLFLLVSIVTRLALEGGGLNALLARQGVVLSEDLHSMGLVVVPLAANALWRAGIGAGLTRIGVPIVVTWALLELVFLRYTNLSLSSFALTYEDLALDFVSSPRAYILLLVGAAFGSRANVAWGWDFGGIIVPGLLALCWLDPARLLATLGEVVVLTWLLRSAIRLPWLRSANLTGGRPFVLAYTLGYLVKFVLGWLFAGGLVDFTVRDTFGFGYLLTTILALRALKHGDLVRCLVPALVTSFAAFLAASGLGYALTLLRTPATEPAAAPLTMDMAPLVEPPDDTPMGTAMGAGVAPPRGGSDASAEWIAGWTEPARSMELAFSNTGDLADDLADRVRLGTPALLHAGDGFGALRIRGGPGPIVAARVSDAGGGAAALAVAEALDARAVLLCAPSGNACEDAVTRLEAAWPTVRVTTGSQTRLSVRGDATGYALGTLESAIGRVSVEGGAPTDVLQLSVHAALRAEAWAFGAEPGPLAVLPERVEPGTRALPPGAARAYQSGLVRTWTGWLRDHATAQALRTTAGFAQSMGLALTSGGDRSALHGDGWYVLLTRAAAPLVVEVPFGAAEPGAAEVGRLLAAALDATALVVDSGPESGAATSPAHLATLGILEAIGPEAVVVTVRSAGDGHDPGAEAVLSVGYPVPAGTPAPPALTQVDAALSAAGVHTGTWDGTAQRLPFADPVHPTRAATRLAAGSAQQVTVFVTNALADRARTAATTLALGASARPPLPRREVDVRLYAAALAAGPTVPATPDTPRRLPELAAVHTAVDRFFATGDRRALAAARARADLTLLCDVGLGCRWLEVERCSVAGCVGFVTPLRPGLPDGPPSALLLGTGTLPFTRAEAPW